MDAVKKPTQIIRFFVFAEKDEEDDLKLKKALKSVNTI